MIVLVLSKTIASTSFIFSIASLLLTKIPLFAKSEEPIKSEIGVAKPNAHGQDTTITLTPKVNASSNIDVKWSPIVTLPLIKSTLSQIAKTKTAIVIAVGTKIIAKSVNEPSGLTVSSEATRELAKHAITSEAYDGDDETYMVYHTGYNNLNCYDNTTYNKYLYVDNALWNRYVRVKWFSWKNSFSRITYIEFLDENDNVLASHENSNGNTLDENYLIPENTFRIRYRENYPSDSNWEINGKLYEIQLVN